MILVTLLCQKGHDHPVNEPVLLKDKTPLPMFEIQGCLCRDVKILDSIQDMKLDLFSLGLGVYPIMGFVLTLLALETGWHLAVCKLHDSTIAPCMFKQVKILLA